MVLWYLQPQRIRVRGDENAPVALPASKTMHHQRNKSASALLGVPQTGTVKNHAMNKNNNGARRAAFGDVSNTANPVQGSREETALAGRKQPQKGTEKPAVKGPEKKPAVLNQPPQRPHSMTGVRGILSHATQPKPFEQSGKQMTLSSQQAANTRKILNKRSATAVFKDTAQSISETKETTASKETSPDASDDSNDVVSRPATALSLEDIRKEDAVSEARSHDDDESSVVHASDNGADDDDASLIEDDDCQVQEPEEPETVESHCVVSDTQNSNKQRVSSAPDAALTLHAADHESEEYWDEEDEENEEEDDGYVTARSYRSRGDNTTSGATTLLVPKYNQQVKRELLLAKQIVEATQTEEDIEDELWDTSMVAEYGDEIFGYMKEQEVKLHGLYGVHMRSFCLQVFLDQNAAQQPLHGLPGRGSVVDAFDPYGLGGAGALPILSSARDPLPVCQLH